MLIAAAVVYAGFLIPVDLESSDDEMGIIESGVSVLFPVEIRSFRSAIASHRVDRLL